MFAFDQGFTDWSAKIWTVDRSGKPYLLLDQDLNLLEIWVRFHQNLQIVKMDDLSKLEKFCHRGVER